MRKERDEKVEERGERLDGKMDISMDLFEKQAQKGG